MAFQGSKILLYLLAVFVAVQASPVSYFQPVEGPHDIFYANVHDIPRSTEHHILKPRSHPDHDASDHVHLLPDETKDLFWSQSSMNGRLFVGGKFVSSSTTFKHPTVVLDHSMHVSTTLKGQVLTVRFEDGSIYTKTTASWTDLPMLLVTAVGSDEGHFQYLLASSIDCQDRLITCMMNVTAANFEHITDEFVIKWGHYEDLKKKSMAPWGPDQFDHHLDAQNGYYTFDDGTTDLAMFAPGLADHDLSHYFDQNKDYGSIIDENGNFDLYRELEIHDADFFEEHEPGVNVHQKRNILKDGLKKLGGAVKETAKTIKNKTVAIGTVAVQAVKQKVIDPLVKVAGYVTGSPMPLKLDKWQKTVPETKDNPNPQQTFKKEGGEPYKAREIYKSSKNSKVEKKLYCLECGVTVTASFNGELAYKIGSGVQRGHMKVEAGFLAQLLLGFEAGIEVEKDLMNKRVAEFTIPGLGVPGVFAIGPMLTLDAKAALKAGITGNVMVGGTLDIKITHEFDLKDTKKKNKPKLEGPTFKSIFNAEAEISAGLVISTPIGLAVGISIGGDKLLGLTAGLYSEPAIEAKAVVGITADKNGVKAANDCKGVKVSFEIQHTLYAQVSAKVLKKELIKEGKYELHKAQKELAGTCFPIKAMQKLPTRETANETQIDVSIASKDAVKIDEAVTDTAKVDTPFANEDFILPQAVADFVTPEGPPDYWSDPNVDPMDTTATTFNYTFISDENLEWDLVATDNGNLGLQFGEESVTTNAIFEVFDSVVMGDAFGRIMVYFPEELKKYGVSRYRLENGEAIPKGCEIIGLVPVRDDSLKIPADSNAPKALLVAVDTTGIYLYTVLCTYKDKAAPSKIFLVADVDKGIATLKDPATDNTLTGAAIEACTFWPMVNGLDSVV